MAAWRDVEGRAMRDSLSRLRMDASKATTGGEEEDTRPIDPRPLLVKAFGKDVVDKVLNPEDEPAVPPRTRRGRRQSMEFEDLHLHTETGKLLLPPALQVRLGSRSVTSAKAVASALADPVWAGDPEAIHSVRRPLRSVQQQRRDHFVQIASSSSRARAGTFSHADRQFIRAKLSPLHADKPGSPSSPRVPGSPLPGNRHGAGSPKGGKQTPLRKISTGSMGGKDADTGKQSATPHLKSSIRDEDGSKQASTPYRKISTGSMSSRDAELTSAHARGGYSPATTRKVSSTSVSSREQDVTSGTGALQQSPSRSRKTSTISIVSSSSSSSSGGGGGSGGGGKKDGGKEGSPRRKTSTSKQAKDGKSPSPQRKTSTGKKK